MKTIKFLPNKNILLNNKLLTKIKNTNEYTSWYTIKGNNYAQV